MVLNSSMLLIDVTGMIVVSDGSGRVLISLYIYTSLEDW